MSAARAFGGLDDDEYECLLEKPPIAPSTTTTSAPSSSSSSNNKEYLLKGLRGSIVGTLQRFATPFGDRPLVYVDWTASGKSVLQVDAYLAAHVVPLYGNTHTTTSITGHQSTCFRHEARQIVAEAVNAKVTGRAAEDVVIFTGNGTTAAVTKLILSLGLHLPLPEGYDPAVHRPIVFTSSYEHHSNLVSWRETVADVVAVKYSPATGVCLADLGRLLVVHAARRVKIGSFSAASNVTGVLTATNEVCAAMHRAGGWAFFDYATAAPYVKIDMNPVCVGDDAAVVHKDAVFFSGHKFIGGPGCPGVLVVKRNVLPAQTSLPTVPGGGTVFYVTEDHHRFLSNREEREEGGTPNILGDVKLGLVVAMKQSIGAAWIEQEELRVSHLAQARLEQDPRIVLLGRSAGWTAVVAGAPSSSGAGGGARHLPIFSFLVRCGAHFLHHNFVCALLNDLFGVQSRGGCQCAGPFSQQLLGLSAAANQRLEAALLDKHEVLRPGYSRLSLAYWMSPAEVEYVLDAVLFVAEHGAKFLPLYRYNYKTGEWAHTTRLTRFPERKWLSHFSIAAPSSTTGGGDGGGENGGSSSSSSSSSETPLAAALASWGAVSVEALLAQVARQAQEEAAKLDQAAAKHKHKHTQRGGVQAGGAGGAGGGTEARLSQHEELRWFALAHDSAASVPADGAVLGPIQPASSPYAASDDPAAAAADAGETLYAQKRGEKLCARAGGEGASLPRYLSLTASPSSASAAAAAGTAVPPARVSVSAPSHDGGGGSPVEERKMSLECDAGGDGQATAPPPPAAAAAVVVATAGGAAAAAAAGADLTCSTGTCSLRQREGAVPPTTFSSSSSGAAAAGADDGKVQSGPGVTYAPAASPAVKHALPPKKIMKLVGQAVKEWAMIQDGDRLLLGLSGGKDSLALLHVLLALQKRAPVKFDIACATVDGMGDPEDRPVVHGRPQSAVRHAPSPAPRRRSGSSPGRSAPRRGSRRGRGRRAPPRRRATSPPAIRGGRNRRRVSPRSGPFLPRPRRGS